MRRGPARPWPVPAGRCRRSAGARCPGTAESTSPPARGPRRRGSRPWCRRADAAPPAGRARRRWRPAGPGWPAVSPTGRRRARVVRRIRQSPSRRPAPRRRPRARSATPAARPDRRPGSWSCLDSTTGTNPPTHARSCWRRTDCQLVGVSRQEAVGSQLGRGQSRAAHLGEHPLGVRAGSPSRAPRTRPTRSAPLRSSCVVLMRSSPPRCVTGDAPLQRLGGGLGQPGDLDRVGDRARRDGAALGDLDERRRARRGTPR